MLFRFDPFETIDKAVERRQRMLAMDAVRTDDKVYVYFDAPGLEPDDIDLTVEQSSITVEATRRWYDADNRTLTSERPQGVFRRQIQFADSVDTDAVSARLDKGVLTLELPVKEDSKARSISIESTQSAHKELETSSS